MIGRIENYEEKKKERLWPAGGYKYFSIIHNVFKRAISENC